MRHGSYTVLLLPGAIAYTPPSGTLFFEPFSDNPLSKGSTWTVADPVSFPGTWGHKTYAEPVGLPGDKGLVLSDAGKRHAISTIFPEPIAGAPLVIQYELNLERQLSCGGAYLKLLQADDELSQLDFGESTPYAVMFGPVWIEKWSGAQGRKLGLDRNGSANLEG